MLPVGIVLSIEVKTDLLIEMDRVGVGLIYTEIYGITGIFCSEPVKQGKHDPLSVPFALILFIDQQPVQPNLPRGRFRKITVHGKTDQHTAVINADGPPQLQFVGLLKALCHALDEAGLFRKDLQMFDLRSVPAVYRFKMQCVIAVGIHFVFSCFLRKGTICLSLFFKGKSINGLVWTAAGRPAHG